MERNQSFEEKMRKLLRSQVDEQTRRQLKYLPEGEKCTWMNAICLSLAGKAASGDLRAIKCISEICAGADGHKAETVTVRVVD